MRSSNKRWQVRRPLVFSVQLTLAKNPLCNYRVYSLGATLFELLTLERPFPQQAFPALVQQILHSEPPSGRRLDPSLSQDLETVLNKSMARLPSDRYDSADDLAEDLDRFLRGQPVHARRLTPLQRAHRRHQQHGRAVVVVAALLVMLSLAALAGLSLHSSSLSKKSEQLQASQERTRQLLHATEMNRAYQAARSGQSHEAQSLLDQQRPGPHESDLRGLGGAGVGGFSA